jgi:hypothetical protein
MERFEVHATNDVTSVLIAKKYTLAGALNLASELLDTWTDVHVRRYATDEDETFKVVAKLSNQGMIF